MYCLINEQECFIRYKSPSVARAFISDKTRSASLLNGLKNSNNIRNENFMFQARKSAKKRWNRLMTILNMRTHAHNVSCMCPTFDTDFESVKGTALMVLTGSDPWTILVTWLNRGCFVPCRAISLVFDNDTRIII